VGKSEAEYLFLGTVAEIDQRVLEGGRYNLIRAAGLLRQLFLDSTPLLHVVNRTYCQQIEFETIDYRDAPPLSPEVHAIFLDASYFPGAKTIRVNLDTFLKAPCLRVGPMTANVHDLIRACANAKGGIHLGRARTSQENTVLDWDRTFRLVGKEPSLLAVAAVCRIALRGLRPLVRAITGLT
jgi:hypothetical protein